MRYVRLFVSIFSMSITREIAHRGNLLVGTLQAIVGSGAALLTIQGVFGQTTDLAGWSKTDVILLLGTFQMLSGLLATFVEPNVLWFSSKVHNGLLDELLLKPVPGLLLASLGSHAPLGLLQVAVGSGIWITGLSGLERSPSFPSIVSWLLLTGASVIIVWSSRVSLALLAFWFPLLALDVLYSAVWQFARYPIEVFRHPIRGFLTWIVPLAFLASIPTRALTSSANGMLTVAAFGVALAGVVLTVMFWNLGLRRYTGATG